MHDRPHPMRGPNRLKLGVFSANADGGLTLTRVPERWRAEWHDVVDVARMADRAGLEFFLPIARWKGFGGVTNSREWSFETLTEAAALAGLTERIALFATVHVPMVHPVFAAKALTTIDHASGGRAGLNIVCGWNPEEFGCFGLEMIEDRYGQGLEWFEIMTRIFTESAPFDFKGQYYDLRGVSGKPNPVQKPRPMTLNAAFSPPGRDFAARAADCLFTTFVEIDRSHTQIEDMRQRTAATGRQVGVYTTCHVVCRPSQDEADAYYEHYRRRRSLHGQQSEILQFARSGGISVAPQAVRGWGGNLSADRYAAAHRRGTRGDQRGRLRGRGVVLRELQRRVAVLH
jgi:FMNH2-dependent dimethyl sulfone monooxygenase